MNTTQHYTTQHYNFNSLVFLLLAILARVLLTAQHECGTANYDIDESLYQSSNFIMPPTEKYYVDVEFTILRDGKWKSIYRENLNTIIR